MLAHGPHFDCIQELPHSLHQNVSEGFCDVCDSLMLLCPRNEKVDIISVQPTVGFGAIESGTHDDLFDFTLRLHQI